MAEVIRMPLMSDTMEEGTIAGWNKKVGDKVEPGDILAEVETDKATMELESYQEGTLLYIGSEKGESVPVNGILAIIGEEGEDYKELLEKETSSEKTEEKEPAETEVADKPEKKEAGTEARTEKKSAEPATQKVSAPEPEPSQNGRRIKASPLAKKIARESNVELERIKGTGDEGRIIKRDVELYLSSHPEDAPVDIPQVIGEEDHEEVPVSQMRKTIAKRLAASKFSAPHFYLTMEINMDRTVEARKNINESSPVKISFNDILIKAVSVALRKNIKVNASWMDDKIRYNKHIHIGMAVAVEEGLIVPVIRFADNKTLTHIAKESKDFAKKAKEKKLQPSDWEGNTFTISNLGMYDIEEFTAIINPPDACILAVGSIQEKPIVKNGEITTGHMMKVTLSCDHRVVDGATGSDFLQTLKELLEEPLKLLV